MSDEAKVAAKALRSLAAWARERAQNYSAFDGDDGPAANRYQGAATAFVLCVNEAEARASELEHGE